MTMFPAIVLAILVLLQNLPPAAPQEPETYVEQDAYAIYSLLLKREDTRKMFVIASETSVRKDLSDSTEICNGLRGQLHGEWASVYDNFVHANRRPRKLVRGFAMKSDYALVTPTEIEAAFRSAPEKAWDNFYARYPRSRGVVDLSLVGFNSAKTRAVVQIAYYCGFLCGNGAIHLFEKVEGKWKEADLQVHKCGWIA